MPRKPTAHDQLATHDRTVAESQTRARAAAGAIAQQADQLERLKRERVEAFANGDEATAKRLSADRAKVEAELTDLHERRQGAELAVSRAHAERATYLSANVGALLGELEPEARAAAEAIETAAAALQAARTRWHVVEGQVTTLLRATEGNTRSVPGIEAIDKVVKALGLVVEDIPLPLPSTVRQTITPPHVMASVEGTGR